jgi:hypothetical protein
VTARKIETVPVGNRDAYEELADPAGPAVGGEPCRICREPIPDVAHPVQKARRVCSPRCNNLLKRRHKRAEQRREGTQSPRDEPEASAEDTLRFMVALRVPRRPPRTFHTVSSNEFPYEFDNGSPFP